MSRLMLLVVILSALTIAHADERHDIAKCAAITSNAARLGCYDDIAKALGVKEPSIAQSKGAGHWRVTTEKSPIDDSTNIYLSVPANQTISSTFTTSRPVLFVRCAQNNTDVFIDWGVYLGIDNTQMLTRIDREKAATNEWDISTDDKAVFVRGSAPAFAKELIGHRKLLAQIIPYGQDPVMVTFDITGLREAIKPLRRACHW